MKVCSKCKIEKEETNFYVDNSTKDRLRSFCKMCEKIKSQKPIASIGRICPKCNTDKPLTAFYKGNKTIVGTSIYCKACNVEFLKNWRKKTGKMGGSKRSRNALSKKYYNNHKLKINTKASKKYYENINEVRPKVNEQARKGIANLNKGYLNQKLKREGVPKESIEQYPILQDLKRIEILNKREIKKQQKDDNANQQCQ